MSLPISKAQAAKVSQWMRENFGGVMQEYLKDTPWTMDIAIAIACKETAYKWIGWIDKYDPQTILARCVFDTSGEPEFPANPRSAFPKNREVFIAHYGLPFYKMLNAEYNLNRSMPQPGYANGYSSLNTPYLAKGYGIFQYDLQHITTDVAFFKGKQWYNMSDCLYRLIKELNAKAQVTSNLKGILKAYNGAGIKAEQYSEDVMQLLSWV